MENRKLSEIPIPERLKGKLKVEYRERDPEFHYNFWMKLVRELEHERNFVNTWVPEEKLPDEISMVLIRSMDYYREKIELYKRYALEKGEKRKDGEHS